VWGLPPSDGDERVNNKGQLLRPFRANQNEEMMSL